MTRQELTETLGFKTMCSVSTAITKAKERHPDVFGKDPFSRTTVTNFNPDEIEAICREIEPPMNEIEIQLVREKCEANPSEKRLEKTTDIYIEGQLRFLKRLEGDRHAKVCANCLYCTGKDRAGKGPTLHPYCTFYDKFCARMKVVKYGREKPANVFLDGCPTWRKGDVHLFYKPKYTGPSVLEKKEKKSKST